MKDTKHKTKVTATGVSETPEPAVGGWCSPRVSLSLASIKNSEVPSQASVPSQGAGNTTGGVSEKQAHPGGKQATEVTARSTQELYGKEALAETSIRAKLLASSTFKRKCPLPAKPVEEEEELFLTRTLHGLISKCMMATAECAIAAASCSVENPLQEMLWGIISCLEGLVARRALRSPSRKKASDLKADSEGSSTMMIIDEHGTMDCGTQTDLPVTDLLNKSTIDDENIQRLPSDSAKKSSGNRKNKKVKTVSTTLPLNKEVQDTTEPSDDKSEGTWSEVVKRRHNPKTVTKSEQSMAPVRLGRLRPPAVLIKVLEGKTYEDTVKVVRQTNIDVEGFGTRVTAMKKTRTGNLLVELEKTQNSTVALDKFRNELSSKLGENTGTVTKLSSMVTLEVLDIDAAATTTEVLQAVRNEVPGDASDPITTAIKSEIEITGLWSTKFGQQIATVKVPHTIANKISRATIGWIQCRVRVRAPEPLKCYRCHGYGHVNGDCKGPDLHEACCRCGGRGHKAKECIDGEDKCVACDRINAQRKPHKPGSSSCTAFRAARTSKVVKTTG